MRRALVLRKNSIWFNSTKFFLDQEVVSSQNSVRPVESIVCPIP